MTAQIEFTRHPIAVLPPVLPSREIGASLDFQGIVREMENDAPLQGLHYEAHEPMARKLLERHVAALAELHPVSGVHFIHRLGWVPVGEASLFIRVLSVHRGEGLEFLAALVNRLKQDVPIWKMTAAPSEN